MKTLRILIFVFIAVFALNDAQAQVPKKIIVEHFTNTRCGLCSFNNPGFYDVYNNNPEVLHVSYHPSSPYSSCLLHSHNKAENDDRTKYYNVYGGTPKFVIQGKRNNNYAQANVYDAYKGQFSDVSLVLEQYLDDAGMINANVTLKNETGANLDEATLFVGIAEAVVNYAAPNGENEHLDVFRKAFTPAVGESVNLNETSNLSYKIEVHPEWDLTQLFVYAIVQQAGSKDIIQTEAAEPGIERLVNIDNYVVESTTFYPNPATSFIYSNINFEAVEIYNNKGQLTLVINAGDKLDVSQLENGIYFVKAVTKNGSTTVQKFLKK